MLTPITCEVWGMYLTQNLKMQADRWVGQRNCPKPHNGIDFHEKIESGERFADVVLKKNLADTVVVLEFKKEKKNRLELIDSADYATAQIVKQKYAVTFTKEGYSKVYCIGIGFGGKDA